MKNSIKIIRFFPNRFIKLSIVGIFILFTIFLLFFIFWPTFIRIFASSRSWPFDQGSNYLYDSSKIEVISSYAQLKSAQPIWWNTSYKYRRQITITNNSSSTLPSGYSVKIVLDHRSLVNEGKSLASGDDLRIIYFNGTTNLELDRVNETSFNSPATEIWFKTQASIPPSSSDSNYFLYYGNPSASDPAQNKENVYLFFDDFESGNLNKWTVQIDEVWSVASDKSYSGDRSLKIKNNINDTHKWITANGINESNLYFESYWRMKKSAKLDIAQGVRCSSSLPINQYETNLEGSDGWDIAKLIDGNWTEITENTGTPVNNRWIKITTIIFGTKMKVLKDDSVLIDWTDVGEELNSGTIGFRAWKARRGARWWIDDVKVRKYIDPEPSLALGEEKTNYPTDKPTIRPNESNYQTYSALSEFLTQEEVNGGSIRYQITNEGEKTDPTWYYFDGTNWTIATNKDQSNDAQTINDHLQEFVEQIGEGNFSFKAILISDGSQFVRLDDLDISFEYPVNNPPEVRFISASQLKDGSGWLSFNLTISDKDLNETKLKIEYSTDEGNSWYRPWLVQGEPDQGEIILNNENEYQIEEIDTDEFQEINLILIWDTKSEANGGGSLANTFSTILLRFTPNDGIESGEEEVSYEIKIDNLSPLGLSNLLIEEISSFSVILSWSRVEESNFSHYELSYGTDLEAVENREESIWSVEQDSNLSLIETTSTRISGLTSNTSYYVKLWAIDEFKNESSTEVIEFTTSSSQDTQPPSPVTSFTLSGARNKIYLFWDNPTDSDFQGVLILRKDKEFISEAPSDGITYQIGEKIGESQVIFNSLANSYLDSNLLCGKRFYYAIFAYDNSLNYSSGVFGSEYSFCPSAPTLPSLCNWSSLNSACEAVFPFKEKTIGLRDKTIILEVPAGTVKVETEFLILLKKRIPYLPSHFYKLKAFEIIARLPSTFRKISKFSKEITIKVKYKEADLEKVEKDSLKIYFWNLEKEKWEPLFTDLDSKNNLLITKIDHLTLFAVLGERKIEEKLTKEPEKEKPTEEEKLKEEKTEEKIEEKTEEGAPEKLEEGLKESEVSQFYQVKKGDSLYKIAEKFWGDGSCWLQLLHDNKEKYPQLEKNPNLIQIGWVLKISFPCTKRVFLQPSKIQKPSSVSFKNREKKEKEVEFLEIKTKEKRESKIFFIFSALIAFLLIGIDLWLYFRYFRCG